MDILNGLSDDQTAMAGCAVVLLVSATLMSLSYYIGRASRKREQPIVSKSIAEPELLTPDTLAESQKKAA